MPFDLVAFGSTAARNGLTVVPPLEAGSRSGYNVINTNFIRAKTPGAVWFVTCLSAAIANLDEFRLRDVQDGQWVHLRTACRDQTGVPHIGTFGFLQYPYPSEALLGVEIDNTNNNQLEIMLLALAPANPGLRLDNPFGAAGAKPIAGTGATAAVASTWTHSLVTWSETFETNKTYQIVGMAGWSATMYALRLVYPQAPMSGWNPGVPGCDTITCQTPMYGNFGQFKGDNPPNIEVLCSGTDAAQNVTIWIVPARK